MIVYRGGRSNGQSIIATSSYGIAPWIGIFLWTQVLIALNISRFMFNLYIRCSNNKILPVDPTLSVLHPMYVIPF
jgi:hypothetical protein